MMRGRFPWLSFLDLLGVFQFFFSFQLIYFTNSYSLKVEKRDPYMNYSVTLEDFILLLTPKEMEVFTNNFLYFSFFLNINLKLGSNALFKCVNNIKQRISYSNKDATKNDEIARFHFFALLYSYLKIHNFFRNLSNEMWFWLQIYPKSIHSNGEDIFEKIYDLVSDLCKDMSLSDLIKKEINKYKEICGGKKPIVALDEIHILGSGEMVFSAPTSIGEFRALFSRIIYEFCKMEIFTVAAGTSLRLKDALSVAVSAVGKLNVDVNEYLIVNFGGLFTFRDLKDYFFQFFGKPDPKSSVGWTEKTISRIYRFLQGFFLILVSKCKLNFF